MTPELEKRVRENKRILGKTQPEPERGMKATLVTMLSRKHVEILKVNEREMFVVDERQTLYGFRRRKGTKKWRYAGGELTEIYVGEHLPD